LGLHQVCYFFSSYKVNSDGAYRLIWHTNVRNSDGEAKFWLTPTVYLADGDGFDARTLRDLRDAVVANQLLIERAWNDHFA
jgi:hypothetical protein